MRSFEGGQKGEPNADGTICWQVYPYSLNVSSNALFLSDKNDTSATLQYFMPSYLRVFYFTGCLFLISIFTLAVSPLIHHSSNI